MNQFEYIPDLTKLSVKDKMKIREYLDLPKYYRIDNFLKEVMNNASVLLHTLQNVCESNNIKLVEWKSDDGSSECVQFGIHLNWNDIPLLCLLNYKHNSYYIFIFDDHVMFCAKFDFIKFFEQKAITKHKIEYYSVAFFINELCESLTRAFNLMINETV